MSLRAHGGGSGVEGPLANARRQIPYPTGKQTNKQKNSEVSGVLNKHC